jgi:hypothetical protein
MILATDVDGTLLERGRVLAIEEAHALAALVRRGWTLAVVTGQNITDVRERLLGPIAATGIERCIVYTCEGACRWLFSSGRLILDRCYTRDRNLSRPHREQLEYVTSEFVSGLEKHGRQCFAFAGWWEQAIFVLKVLDPAAVDRCAIAADLRTLLRERVPPDLMHLIDVRIAGRTTVILTRAGVNKAMALQDLRRRWQRAELLYVGDEFGPHGNDAPAAVVPGLRLVCVGEAPVSPAAQVTWMGGGPRATFRLVRALAVAGLPAKS